MHSGLLPMLILNAAFIGVLSETRLGRRVACVGLALLMLSMWWLAYHSMQSPVVIRVLALLLAAGHSVLFWLYTFAQSTRHYYRQLWQDLAQ